MSSNEDKGVGVSIHAGFPNPAEDRSLGSLDINQLLIAHPASTFLFRIEGNEWNSMGIFDRDIAIIDRVLQPRKSDIVIWWHESEFALSTFSSIPSDATVWGIVTATIHEFRKTNNYVNS